MPSPLEVQLTKALQPFPSGITFEIYDLPTKSEPYKLFLDDQKPIAQVVQRLIIVTAQTESCPERLVVLAIEAYEYKVHQGDSVQKIVYIGKVDTSGAEIAEFAKSGLTRKVVAAYIKSLGDCMIYFTSVAHAQYIFRDSKQNRNKQILQNKDLVKWWRKTLQSIQQDLSTAQTNQEPDQTTPSSEPEQTPVSTNPGIFDRLYRWWFPNTSSPSSSCPSAAPSSMERSDAKSSNLSAECRAWWNIPSFNKEEAYQAFGIQSFEENHDFWTYGHPFDQTAPINTTIPCFPDDPLGRMVQSINDTYEKDDDGNGCPTVREFWAILAVAQEFNYGTYNCIFSMRIKNGTAASKEMTDYKVEYYQNVDPDTYTDIWNIFMENRFKNNSDIKASTYHLLERWKKNKLKQPVKIITSGANPQNSSVNILVPPQKQEQQSPSVSTLAPRSKKQQRPSVNTLAPRKKHRDSPPADIVPAKKRRD